MLLYILNQNFERVAVVDTWESLIWTDRYAEAGEVEIYCLPTADMLEYAQLDYYLINPESEHVMIIEGRSITTDAEDGDRLVITGRSLESILDRRVVWTQTTLNGTLQAGIKKLITDAFISPSVADRKINNFVFEESTDAEILAKTLDAQYTGDVVYDIVKEECENNKIGFKITLNDSNQFVFKLYQGANRSYSQTENAYVIFSQSYENIVNSEYVESAQNYKNVARVGGEGEGSEQKFATAGSGSGLTRREMYTNASSTSSNGEDRSTISDAEYTKLLIADGEEALADVKNTKAFDGEIATENTWIINKDFFLGDRVQFANQYGMEGEMQITEVVWSYDDDGISCYPTFKEWEDDSKEGT